MSANNDVLRMDYINSLPQPLIANFYNLGDWLVDSIDVETGLMRIYVCGLCETKHIGGVSYFIDAKGNKHDPETFYLEYENQ